MNDIAMLGTGVMGFPIASRLAAAGYSVATWNRTFERAALLERDGVANHETARLAVNGASYVILLLTDGPAFDEILFGHEGIAQNLSPGSTIIAMSSIPVETAKTQARHPEKYGIAYIDALESGGEKVGLEGTLTVIVRGDKEIVVGASPDPQPPWPSEPCLPAGTGQLTKLANQPIVGITIGAVAGALRLAQDGGADLRTTWTALEGGFADSTVLRQHGRPMAQGDFKPGARARLQLKDLNTAQSLAGHFSLANPFIDLARSLFMNCATETLRSWT